MKQEDLKEILALLAESEKMAYCLATHASAIKFDYEYPEIKNRLEHAIEKVKFEIDSPSTALGENLDAICSLKPLQDDEKIKYRDFVEIKFK